MNKWGKLSSLVILALLGVSILFLVLYIKKDKDCETGILCTDPWCVQLQFLESEGFSEKTATCITNYCKKHFPSPDKSNLTAEQMNEMGCYGKKGDWDKGFFNFVVHDMDRTGQFSKACGVCVASYLQERYPPGVTIGTNSKAVFDDAQNYCTAKKICAPVP